MKWTGLDRFFTILESSQEERKTADTFKSMFRIYERIFVVFKIEPEFNTQDDTDDYGEWPFTTKRERVFFNMVYDGTTHLCDAPILCGKGTWKENDVAVGDPIQGRFSFSRERSVSFNDIRFILRKATPFEILEVRKRIRR